MRDKKKPSLSAGPDTISQRHVIDLLPALEEPLQLALGKPIDKLPDVSHNIIRLISKEKRPKLPLNEKSQRPIGELDILPKYGPIDILMTQLRAKLMPRLKSNQYALPGRGGPMCTYLTLDSTCVQAALGKKVYLAFWDFSNAFCTNDHGVTMQIADAYNLSPKMMELLLQFLEQSTATIKMNDVNGYYLSEPSTTSRGGVQGQIGTDFIFAMVNDAIDPTTVGNESVDRKKYVDDFTDLMASMLASELEKSLEQNELALSRAATAIGLKLNDDKTKILPINFTELERPKNNLDPKEPQRVVDAWVLLGFPFRIARTADPVEGSTCKKKNETITGDPAGQAMIGRLNESVRVMNTIRKTSSSLDKRINNACCLVYKSCYDIGLVKCYASNAMFKSVEVAIKKVLKAAGLDHMMDTDILYRCTLKTSPNFMATKQIIQLGIKSLDAEKVKRDRYLVKVQENDEFRPFWSKFTEEFNKLPRDTRVHVIDNLDPLDKCKVEKIKTRLKTHFAQRFDRTPFSKKKVTTVLQKHKYSRSTVLKRKRTAETLRHDRAHNTPDGKRFRLSCPGNLKKFARINLKAPPRPQNRPSETLNCQQPLDLILTVVPEPTVDTPSTNLVSVSTPVQTPKPFNFKKIFKKSQLSISNSQKRSNPENDNNTFCISFSDSLNVDMPGKGSGRGDKKPSGKETNTKKVGKSKAQPPKNNYAQVPSFVMDQLNKQSDLQLAMIEKFSTSMQRSSGPPEESSTSKKTNRKPSIIVLVNQAVVKYIKKPFWDSLKKTSFNDRFNLIICVFQSDGLPKPADIKPIVKKVEIDNSEVSGVIFLPMGLKHWSFYGDVKENLLNPKKRKLGFAARETDELIDMETEENEPEASGSNVATGTVGATEITNTDDSKAAFAFIQVKFDEMKNWTNEFYKKIH